MISLSTWEWIVFGVAVMVLLAIDIFVHRGEHADSRTRALWWTAVWVAAGLAFNVFVWYEHGGTVAQEYLASYLLEKSLSLDNLFVFLIIFRTMRIPKDHQRKALLWGVFGALVFRAIFIFLGAEALERWHWVEYIFAFLLLYAAWHAFREDPTAEEEESKLVDWLAHHLPVSRHTKHAQFFVHENGKWLLTPLMVAVIGLELTDVMFAIDSVPAAFSVTDDVFVVYSSNVFAILGLRSLYIAMASTIADLRYLHYGLGAVLAFAGVKMLASDIVEIHPLASVGIIVACIGVAIYASVRAEQRSEEPPLQEPTVEPDAGTP